MEDKTEECLQTLCSKQVGLVAQLQKDGNVEMLALAISGLRDLQEVLLKHQECAAYNKEVEKGMMCAKPYNRHGTR